MRINASIARLNEMVSTVSERFRIEADFDNRGIVMVDDSFEETEIVCRTKTIPAMELFVKGLIQGRDTVG